MNEKAIWKVKEMKTLLKPSLGLLNFPPENDDKAIASELTLEHFLSFHVGDGYRTAGNTAL